MFPPTSLNGAGYGGGGNRTRVVSPQVWLYAWGNNERRAELKGRTCTVLATGRLRSCLVEFENGERVVTSQRALRKTEGGSRTAVQGQWHEGSGK